MKHGSTSRERDHGVGTKSGAAGCWRLWLLLVLLVAGSLRAETNIIRRQVLLPDGRPAVGAKIHGVATLRSPYDEQRREIRTVTDAEGQFVADFGLKNIEDGFLTIDATNCALFARRYYEHHWITATNTAENIFPTIRLQRAFSVPGRVVDEDNRGVVNARVVTVRFARLWYPSHRPWDLQLEAWPEFHAISGEEGRFALRGVDDTEKERERQFDLRAYLAVSAPGRERSLSGLAMFTHPQRDGSGPATNPVVVLHPTISVSGRVMNPISGRPVEGAKVSVGHERAFQFPPVVTGADGRFAFRDVPSFEWLRLSVMHTNYAEVKIFQKGETARRDFLSQKPVENLEIHLRPVVTVSGKIVDADSGGQTLVPVELHLKEESLTQGFVQKTHPFYKPGDENVPTNGMFSVRVPAGPAAFHVASSSSTGAYRKAYDHELVINVPPDGQRELLLKIPRKPGVLVQLESSEPWKMQRVGYGGDLIINVREEKSNGFGYADYTPLWFFPVEEWGRKMEVNMVRRINRSNGTSDDIEIFPWTGIVADPKTWPVRLKVP